MEKKVGLSKEEKKLRAITNRIRNRCKAKGALDAELADFQQTELIFQSSDPVAARRPEPLPESEVFAIPKAAPGCSVLQGNAPGWLFNEAGLKLSSFVAPGENIFGRPVAALSVPLFRKLLLARVYELRSDNISAGVSLYVLHLLAASACPALVQSCADFLRRFPCSVTVRDVLPLLLNLGLSANAVWGPSFPVHVPEHLVSAGQAREDLPLLNIQKLMEYLGCCADGDLMACDASVEPVLVALSQLALDKHVRASPVLPGVTGLLSQLANRCSVTVGADAVAEWLLRCHDHPLNQLEVNRLTVTAEPPLQRALFRRTIKNVLQLELTRRATLQAKDLPSVVRTCNTRPKELLPVYVALQLLIAVLPSLAIASEDVLAVNKELGGLERSLAVQGITLDTVRLGAASAQLRALLLMERNVQHRARIVEKCGG